MSNPLCAFPFTNMHAAHVKPNGNVTEAAARREKRFRGLMGSHDRTFHPPDDPR